MIHRQNTSNIHLIILKWNYFHLIMKNIETCAMTFLWRQHLLFEKNIPIGTLPEGLTHLYFGNLFRRKLIKGVISNSLTHLELSSEYKHKI